MKSKYSYPQKLLHTQDGKAIKRLPQESRSQYWDRCRLLTAIETDVDGLEATEGTAGYTDS
uniref:Uncharacterized protein n=1 Tax=viral metagenome TaxID=1070528 RepID=A0A6M3JW74_9ZZZZ